MPPLFLAKTGRLRLPCKLVKLIRASMSSKRPGIFLRPFIEDNLGPNARNKPVTGLATPLYYRIFKDAIAVALYQNSPTRRADGILSLFSRHIANIDEMAALLRRDRACALQSFERRWWNVFHFIHRMVTRKM